MASLPGALSLAKNSAVAVLALLLLMTPACNALCRVQVCGAQPTSPEKPACHGSGMKMAGEVAKIALHSVRDCNVRELPAALPMESRSKAAAPSLTGKSSDTVANALSGHADAPARCETVAFLFSRSQSPHAHPSSALPVLRI